MTLSVCTYTVLCVVYRRMFPAIQVRFSGLDRDKTYVVYLDVVPVDWHRYRYAYHRSRWLVTGKADSLVTGQRYRHPDTPLTGHQLTNHVLAFDRVKLTNNGTSKHGQVITFQDFIKLIYIA